MPTIESLISIEQVAKLTGMSVRWVFDAISKELIGPRPVRLGGRQRFRASDIDKWLKAGCPDRQTWDKGVADAC